MPPPFYCSVSDNKFKKKITGTLLEGILNSELVDQELIKNLATKFDHPLKMLLMSFQIINKEGMI